MCYIGANKRGCQMEDEIMHKARRQPHPWGGRNGACGVGVRGATLTRFQSIPSARPGVSGFQRREAMKEGIHPNYQNATVTCTCGNTFETRSTKSEIKTEICSQCHPLYTGKEKMLDTAGRVERFLRKYGQQFER